MELTLRLVALVGLILCVVITLSSPAYPDAASTKFVSGSQTGGTNKCAMFASLSACSTNHILCGTVSNEEPWNCDKQYQVWLDQPTDNACRSMMISSDQDVFGGPMHCVKNEGDPLAPSKCSDNWTGTWVVFDNDHCDWSGKHFQWPVAAGWNLTWSPSFGAKSVQYLNNRDFFQFGLPPPKKRDADLIEREPADSNFDPNADQDKASAINPENLDCSMLSSLSPCASGDILCSWSDKYESWDCSKQRISRFAYPTEKKCISLMDPDRRDNSPAGPMKCVKNQGDSVTTVGCSANWTGDWVVFDNENCDWSGQNYQWPVSSGAKPNYTPPFAAKSVTYLNNNGFFQFGPPSREERDMGLTAGDSEAATQDLDTHTNLHDVENRQVKPCTLITSLLECSNENVWCRGEDCSMGYEWEFAASDRACRNLMGPDKTGKVDGDAMYCVKNQEAANGFGRCDAGWDGFWIFYDNADCDERGQTFSVPVYLDHNGQNYELVGGAMSVRYSYFPEYPGLEGVEVPASASATWRL